MALRMEAEILRHRQLLWIFVKREIRARYSGSIVGIFWSVIHPLIMLAIYVCVIGFILGGGRFGDSGDFGREWFAVFLCCGLFPWNWVSDAFNGATVSVAGNSSLIKRAVFPIAILPVQAVCSAFINFLITFGLFMLALLIFQLAGAWHYLNRLCLLLPLLIALQFLFLLGPCFLLATINVFFRDTAQLISALLAIGFWVTPIIYDPQALLKTARLPEQLRDFFVWLCLVNPFAHLVSLYQLPISKAALPPAGSLIYLLALSLLSYAAGKFLFTRCQPHFVDDI